MLYVRSTDKNLKRRMATREMTRYCDQMFIDLNTYLLSIAATNYNEEKINNNKRESIVLHLERTTLCLFCLRLKKNCYGGKQKVIKSQTFENDHTTTLKMRFFISS